MYRSIRSKQWNTYTHTRTLSNYSERGPRLCTTQSDTTRLSFNPPYSTSVRTYFSQTPRHDPRWKRVRKWGPPYPARGTDKYCIVNYTRRTLRLHAARIKVVCDLLAAPLALTPNARRDKWIVDTCAGARQWYEYVWCACACDSAFARTSIAESCLCGCRTGIIRCSRTCDGVSRIAHSSKYVELCTVGKVACSLPIYNIV